tara:strand:- start:81 stop:1175 length:1095 start_codon:yes stop_codon:yes gene_type:complete
MNIFITKFLNKNFDQIELFQSESNEVYKTDLAGLAECIDSYATLIFMLPCSKYSTYEFEYDSSLSHNINESNFISEIDSYVVNDISTQNIVFNNNQAFLIDRDFLDSINTALSNVNAKIYLIPEHLTLSDQIKEFNLELEDEHLIISNGIPLRISKEMLSSNSLFADLNKISAVKVEDYFDQKFISDLIANLNKLPNIFKFDISIRSLKLHLGISKKLFYGLVASLLLIFFIPFGISALAEKKHNEYKQGIYQIFRALDYNSTNISNPKRQADLIADNFDLSQQNTFKMPNLEFIQRLGVENVYRINIQPIDGTAKIYIKDFPSNQLSALLAISSSFDINILERNINTESGLSSGFILIGTDNV